MYEKYEKLEIEMGEIYRDNYEKERK